MTFRVKIIPSGRCPRSVSSVEKEFLRFGIGSIGENANPIPVFGEDDSTVVNWIDRKNLESQVDSLMVIGICQCGDPDCHTVQFQHYSPGLSSPAIQTRLKDGRSLSIFVNHKSGLISGLQVVME
ncbi:hypothetical protein KKB99_08580 [bacterium]|nr:hypothetical protein [bacterium]MBU1026046.1 hypothetical protein [bacterium]